MGEQGTAYDIFTRRTRPPSGVFNDARVGGWFGMATAAAG